MKEKKIYQKKLVSFLKMKNEIINSVFTLKKINRPKEIKPYIIEKDLDFIMNLNNRDATFIWFNIIFEIFKNNEKGLYTIVCPFCYYYNLQDFLKDYEYSLNATDHEIFNENCFECEYGKNHGVCLTENSTWDYISCNINHEKLFNNKSYRNIIQEIECGK